MAKFALLLLFLTFSWSFARAESFAIDRKVMARAFAKGDVVLIDQTNSHTGEILKSVELPAVRPGTPEFHRLQDDLAYLWYAADKLRTKINVKNFDLKSISISVADTALKLKGSSSEWYVTSLRNQVRELLARECKPPATAGVQVAPSVAK